MIDLRVKKTYRFLYMRKTNPFAWKQENKLQRISCVETVKGYGKREAARSLTATTIYVDQPGGKEIVEVSVKGVLRSNSDRRKVLFLKLAIGLGLTASVVAAITGLYWLVIGAVWLFENEEQYFYLILVLIFGASACQAFAQCKALHESMTDNGGHAGKFSKKDAALTRGIASLLLAIFPLVNCMELGVNSIKFFISLFK